MSGQECSPSPGGILAKKQSASDQAAMIDAVVITTKETNERAATFMNSGEKSKTSQVRNHHHWTPTLRGVSLLNTLLFLGLALSHTKLQAHASSESHAVVSINSEPPTTQGHVQAAAQPKLTFPDIVDAENKFHEDEIDPSAEFTDFETESESPPETGTERKDFIIVAAVDGTLAAVEKFTGKILWKQDGGGSVARYQRRSRDDNHNDGMKLPRDDAKETPIRGEEKLLRPLIATTTTASSTKRPTSPEASRTAAIPSIDGNVFLTTVEVPNDTRTRPSGNSVTRTDTASVRELVARAPYVDPSGRFYVGSRQTTVAALDFLTGEILYVASADAAGDEGSKMGSPEWEGRSVIWIGRVDYSVSVYNAKSSVKEVQFSASEIMSVNDMVAGKGEATKPVRPQQQDPIALISASERRPNHWISEGEAFVDGTLDGDDEAALVATPSGNLAYRNRNTERLEWVSDHAFETPIAYAIHTSSGQSLAVDIIPDVTNPANSKEEYLRSEIERQIELTLQDRKGTGIDDQSFDRHGILDRGTVNPSIVGTLLNGQLYSMPLGRQSSFLPSHTSLATTRTQMEHVLLDASAVDHHRHAAYTSSSSGRESQGLAKWVPAPHDERQLGGTGGICSPSSTTFPSCLFKAVSQRTIDSFSGMEHAASNEQPAEAADQLIRSQARAIEAYQSQREGFEISHQHGHQNSSQQQRKRKRNFRLLKILGSWLPPTIALIFVVSFELGRRKRQQDNLDELRLVHDSKAVDGNELPGAAVQKDGVSNDGGTGHVIQITDQLLGLGSNGTQVFRGTLDGRQVAVKRILKTYVASADREISLLIESDGHPNVVRYFLKEIKGDFVYLALELCDLSLHSLIGTLGAIMMDTGSEGPYPTVSVATKRILLQIAAGVRHLHSLRIVHNDLKPANILLAASKEAKSSDSTSNESIFNSFQMGHYVAKISDMGLGKMLVGQSSFGGFPSSVRGQSSSLTPNGNVGIGPGTVGWMAPEAMRIKSSSSVASDASHSGDSSPLDGPGPSGARASRSVDIFSLGCIFYSTLVPGSHPFGEWYEREANIMHNRPCVETLESLSVEAYDLVSAMIQYNPRFRPTAEQVVEHPYFWASARRLSFICDLSDRLETDSSAVVLASGFSSHPLAIERNAIQVVGLAWDKALHKGLTEQKYRTYDPSSVRDLLRLIRNKKNHFQDLDVTVREKIGSSTDGLMTYFESCFPRLLMHCYKVCCEVLPPSDPLVDKYSLIRANYPIHKAREPMHSVSKAICTSNTAQCVTERKTPESVAGVDTKENEVKGAELEGLISSECGQNETSVGTIDATNEHPPVSSLDSDRPSELTEEALDIKEATSVAQPPPSVADATFENAVVLWQGSTASRALNCRGWIRSDEDWTSRSNGTKKRNGNLLRCAQDPKFRTRLCNHWDTSLGTNCPMRRKGKCVFAHGPVELRIKEGKKHRWGKLVDKHGNNSNPNHSGGEDTYGAARSIESARKEEGKWSTNKATNGGKKQSSNKKKAKGSAGGKRCVA